MQLLESKIPLCFRFLSHSDDDVSAAVMDFTREYVQVIHTKFDIVIMNTCLLLFCIISY